MARTATLIETPRGWLWAEMDRSYRSYVRARRAVAKDDALIARAFGICVRTLTIIPNTAAGRAVVLAVHAKEQTT